MASRSSLGRGVGAVVGVAILVALVLACGPAATPGGAPAGRPRRRWPPRRPRRPPNRRLRPAIATGGPSPTVPGRDAPPDALLAAEGGDPVAGQLGTYVWFESGSDSPWLPGRSARGRGRRAADGHASSRTATSGPGRLATFRRPPRARKAPRPSAKAPAIPRFDAPGPGDWTVEVFVEFAAGRRQRALLLASRGGVNRPGVAHCRRWASRWPPSPVDPVAAPRRPSPSYSSSSVAGRDAGGRRATAGGTADPVRRRRRPARRHRDQARVGRPVAIGLPLPDEESDLDLGRTGRRPRRHARRTASWSRATRSTRAARRWTSPASSGDPSRRRTSPANRSRRRHRSRHGIPSGKRGRRARRRLRGRRSRDPALVDPEEGS